MKGKTVLVSDLWSAVCEEHVLSFVGSDQKLPITTDGTARGVQYDEGKNSFGFCFVECYVRKARSFLRRQRAKITPSLRTALLAV